jgi:glyoxylase-like metal-dependent hydrolase (beta-lactamase superfamily II)
MAKDSSDALFDRATPGPPGELQTLTPLVRRMIAPNPGPFTFTGTCTYVVGRGEVAVIDPGPDDAAHVDALLRALAGETIAYILATHTHKDHSPACDALRRATGAPIVGCAPFRATGPEAPRSQDLAYSPDAALASGERLRGAGFTLTAIATPGHASNHLAFALEEEESLFSGDHVMAWSTTIVSPPDGNMGDYMSSLETLRARGERIYWPGHGGPVRDPQKFVRGLINHRRHRELLVLAALRAGARTIDDLVERLYVGLDPRLRGAAARTVFAHLEDLVARGRAEREVGAGHEAARYRTTDDA